MYLLLSSLPVKLMLAIRRVLNSCIQADFDLTVINDSNKENSAVRDAYAFTASKVWITFKEFVFCMTQCKFNNISTS